MIDSIRTAVHFVHTVSYTCQVTRLTSTDQSQYAGFRWDATDLLHAACCCASCPVALARGGGVMWVPAPWYPDPVMLSRSSDGVATPDAVSYCPYHAYHSAFGSILRPLKVGQKSVGLGAASTFWLASGGSFNLFSSGIQSRCPYISFISPTRMRARGRTGIRRPSSLPLSPLFFSAPRLWMRLSRQVADACSMMHDA